MKFGMPTLLEFKSIEENVSFAKNLNLDFIELNMDLPYCKINKNLKNYDIEFTIHISENYDFFTFDKNLRNFYINELKKIIINGKKYNIKKYNIHLNKGIYFSLPDKKTFINDEFFDEYIKIVKEICKTLNSLAKKYNIEINFENTIINFAIKKAIEIINSNDYLGFTLDIGHNEKDNNIALESFKQNKIRHIHIHDYDGKNDHLEIGSGIIDFKKYDMLIEKNHCVIELKRSNELINSIKFFNYKNKK